MKIDTISTIAISVGSFLLGSSLGLALNDCSACVNVYSPSQEMLKVDAIASEEFKNNVTEARDEIEGQMLDIRDQIIQHARESTNSVSQIVDDESHDALIAINKDIYGDDIYDGYDENVSKYIQENIDESDIDEDAPSEPYVISRDSYENEYLDFHKNSLVYFTEDKILCDDQDEQIDNIDFFIGEESLMMFGEGSDDEDIVFVRNHKIQCDFEVVREHQSYKENVLGIKDTPEYLKAREFFGLSENDTDGDDVKE